MSNDFQWPFSKAPNVSASRLSPPPPPGCCVAHSKPQRARTWGGEERQRGAWFFGFRLFWGNSQRYVIYIYIYIHLRKRDRFFVFTPKKAGMRFSRYVYICIHKCTIMSLSFGYIKEQISETWRMPYDSIHVSGWSAKGRLNWSTSMGHGISWRTGL